MKNKFRKILTVGSAIILAAGSLAGCGTRSVTGNDISTVSAAATSTDADENNTVLTGEGLNETTTIVLGYQAGMGLYELNSKTHFVEDFFANEGIEVKWELFTYGPPMMAALASGDIDIATGLGAAPALTSYANGSDVEFIYQQITDFSNTGVLVREDSGIDSLEDLKGRKVATAVGSAAHISFLQGLEAHGLSEADIEIVNLAAADSLTPLVGGEIDAVATWEPFTSLIENTEGIKAVWRINADNVISPNIIAANASFARSNPEIVAKYIQVFRQYEDGVLEDSHPVIEALVEATGNSESTYVTYTRLERYEPFNAEQIDALEYNINYLYENDLIENDFDVNVPINTSYYEEALRLEEN